MNVLILQQTEREAQRVQAHREELVERIGRAIREDGAAQPLRGLHLSRCSLPLKPVHSVVEPSLCVIAQGSKEVLLGDSRYRYNPSQYLLATVELPRVSQIFEASKERLYRVGYQDASHFNREYKSLFGVPPMRDMQRLREADLESTGQ